LLQCASVDILNLCSNRFEKALLPNINNDVKPRMVCNQEGAKGIECLHIEFTLVEDVFELRTTQKQGENADYMFESRTTQMQERENDEDITNKDTPTVVAYDSKVKLFFSISTFNTCDEWMLHHDMCSMSFTEVLTWIKEGVDHAWKRWIMKHLDWGPNTSAPYSSTRFDEIMATPGANIRVPPWPPPFTIRGGHGIVAVWKINLSRGRLKSKKGRMMRTSLLWIQPRLFVGVGVRLIFGLQESTYLQQLSRLHMDSNLGLLLLHGKMIKSNLRRIQPHLDTLSELVTITDFIQRCILSTVSLFLYDFIDDSENRLLPNNVTMIRNYGGVKEGLKERCGGAKEQQRRPGQVGVPIQVELKSNSDSRNSPHQNHHPDHIPTPFWTFFIWMEG
jgi:hypothetical protein